ncbi:MAG: hypothetical protein Ta2A_06640 [Treponemataceae bacterium]|nr:MAG: hypothetical protein Ta2A_06640 [Treponemataceae bacterium]
MPNHNQCQSLLRKLVAAWMRRCAKNCTARLRACSKALPARRTSQRRTDAPPQPATEFAQQTRGDRMSLRSLASSGYRSIVIYAGK